MKENEHDEVFSRFVTQNSAGLRRTAFLLTGSSGGAEDLLQDALVKLWLRWRHVDHASATAYARRIMVNLSTDRWRRKRYETVSDVAHWHPDERAARDLAASDDRSFITSQLATLSPRERAIVVLRYYHDLSEREVSETIGCSVGTIKSTASRALARLRSRAESAHSTSRSFS